MKLNGRWFPQIVDRDSGNLYLIYIKKLWCSLLNLLAGDLGRPSCLVFVDPHWWVPLCVQRPAKAMPFQQIVMHAWRRCAPPILFWPWPSYNFLPRSCLTCIFLVDPHWWVPLWVQCAAKTMPFQQIIMCALQCQHDVDVHLLFSFDLDLHITFSRGCV